MEKTVKGQAVPRVPGFLSWLFPYKRRHLPIPTNSPLAYYLLQNKISITFFNWLIQGMRGMDRADLIGKIIFNLLFFTLFLWLLNSYAFHHIILALICAHTLNWLVNTHFWDFGRFLGITRTSPERFMPYIRGIHKRVKNKSSVPIVIVIGSIARNQSLGTTSDVDMIFIKGAGFQNAVGAMFLSTWERMLAFIFKFPLHLELYDSMESMKRHRTDEVPVVIKDTEGAGATWYGRVGRKTVNLKDIAKS